MSEKSRGEYSEEELKQTEKTRAFAEGTVARVENFEELNAPTEEEAHEKYIKKTREVFDYFVVHGKENIKDGKLEINQHSDLDGKFATLLFKLGGFDVRDKEKDKENKNLEHVEKGTVGSKEGGVVFDTGNIYGIKYDQKTGKLIIDHHPIGQGVEVKNDTCAAKLIYEALSNLGFLEKRTDLEDAVEFVNQVDNKTFPLDKEMLKDYHRSLFGLAEFIKPEKLVEFFGEWHEASKKILSDEDLKKLGVKYKFKNKKTGEMVEIDRSRDLKDKVDESIELLEQMEKNGMAVDSPSYGKILVDVSEVAKKLPLGFDIARAYGYGAYVMWNPENKSFLINTVGDFKKEHKFDQGIDMRARHMWIKPQKDETPLTLTLKDILSTLSDGGFEATGKLEEYLKHKAGNQEILAPEKPKEISKQEGKKLSKEEAWRILSGPDVVKTIYERKNLEEIKVAFKELTGKDLKEERDRKVEENLKPKHKKILKGEHTEQYRQWIIKKEQERILRDDHSKALDILWKRNPGIEEEDKEKYLSELRKKLGLNVRGGVVTLDLLINEGYEVEKAEKLLFSDKVKIPMTGKVEYLFFDSKKDIGQILIGIKSNITDKAENTARLKIEEGRRILKEERYFCTRIVIDKAVADYNLQEHQGKAKQEKSSEKSAESGEKKKSFEDLVKDGNELVEKFKDAPTGIENYKNFRREIYKLNREFAKVENKKNDRNLIKWEKSVRETMKKLKPASKKLDNTENRKESAESAKIEKPAELSEEELMDEYVPLRKRFNKASGEVKEELGKQVAALKKRIEAAQLKEKNKG